MAENNHNLAEKSLLGTVKHILTQNEDFRDNKGDLKESLVLDCIRNKENKNNAWIITELLNNPQTKKEFFYEVAGNYVFDTGHFTAYLKNKDFLNDSYTAYDIKIGFNIEKHLNEKVVLNFPYKDCILEGGQDKEDSKKDEIFFNEILARDEINRLLEPKVFTNAKRYDNKGEQDLLRFTRDKNINKARGLSENTITDNLLIKGNNLLALHSIENQFAGKVKCIYIDPPYNTGNDSFKYNDKFSRSTWLTFMKNRFEIAKRLLKNDGVIFVQCDDSQQAYLKVLMDEIFTEDNFINTISLKAKSGAGASGGGEDKKLKKNIEYIHVYANHMQSFKRFNPVYKNTPLESYIESMRLNKKSFKYTNVLVSTGKREFIKIIRDGSGQDIKIFKHTDVETKTIKQLAEFENLKPIQIYEKYFDKIYTTTNAQSSIRTRVMDAVKCGDDFYSIDYIPKSGMNKDQLTTLMFTGNKCVLLIWFNKTSYMDNKNKIYKQERYGTFWDGINYNNLNKEGDTIFPSGKKPEELLERIIEMSTKENDIILDYHLGSGTTSAVAHKMDRQWIGIEQLDYGDNDSYTRLKNVVDGDSSGVSKEVNWKGGGNFVYMEIAKHNEKFTDDIKNATDKQTLKNIFENIYKNGFQNIIST